jgi:hypothetical protein
MTYAPLLKVIDIENYLCERQTCLYWVPNMATVVDDDH